MSALVDLSRDRERRLEEAEERKAAEIARQKIEEECAEKVVEIANRPPEVIKSGVLGESEIEELRAACIRELNRDAGTRSIMATLKEFAGVCLLLRLPENHILVPSGQQIEKQVYTRSEADMTGEIARRFVDLHNYSAYASVLQPEGRWKGQIQTIELPKADTRENTAVLRRMILGANILGYVEHREIIEMETRKRQEEWRSKVSEEVPPARSEEDKQPAAGETGGIIQAGEPPPAAYS